MMAAAQPAQDECSKEQSNTFATSGPPGYTGYNGDYSP